MNRFLAASPILLSLIAGAARADFNYSMTRKGAPGGADTTTYTSIKGQKMKVQVGSTVTILDFDAQTITHINHTARSYSVQKFSDAAAESAGGNEITADFKDTGEKKTINGATASQLIMSMQIDNPQLAQRGMKMNMEIEVWVSPDIPGAEELRAFYARNLPKFPWASMGTGADPSMQKAISQLQRKLAQAHGVPVLEIMHVKMSGGAAAQAQADPRMANARAQLEKMIQQGGPQAQAAQQALARMGGAASGGGMTNDVTMEGSGYSTKPIDDSEFAVPSSYTQK